MAEARTLLLFRPEPQATVFADALEARAPGRFRTTTVPLVSIEPVASELDLRGVQGVAFSSVNGVSAFAARSTARGMPAWCVGSATAAAATEAGFAAASAGGDVVALAGLIAARHRPGGGDVLRVRGRHAAGDLGAMLTAAGVPSRSVILYDQVERPLPATARTLLEVGGPLVLVFFSPRGARLFAASIDADCALAAAEAVSISAATDAALAATNIGRRHVARAPDRDAMLDALAALR